MASENSRFGQLLKGYLFFLGKTETELADKIELSLNKLSAGIHGTYRLKREYFDHIATALAEWGIEWREGDYTELMEAWDASARTIRELTPRRRANRRRAIERREGDYTEFMEAWDASSRAMRELMPRRRANRAWLRYRELGRHLRSEDDEGLLPRPAWMRPPSVAAEKEPDYIRASVTTIGADGVEEERILWEGPMG